MAKASDEISHYAEYDYIILNEDTALSHRKIMTILKAERLKRVRQTALSDFVKQLRASL
jgi:guanylate kinase